jgi:hypothetical protein
MPVWSLLLRVVICLLLALNGVGAASVHMSNVADSSPAAQIAVTAADMPCHGHAGPNSQAPDLTKTADFNPRKHSSSDCCKFGLCRCACVQSAQAALMEWFTAVSIIEHELSARPLSLGHAAPALPHLIRPPIS